MNLYAESSAVLGWLLGEPSAPDVRAALDAADRIVASDVTLVECDRVLIRAVTLRDLREAAAAERRSMLNRAAAQWDLFHVSDEIVERARRPFPGEPIRTLDAVHLATALSARAALADLGVLSLDDRVRGAASALGFDVLPQR